MEACINANRPLCGNRRRWRGCHLCSAHRLWELPPRPELQQRARALVLRQPVRALRQEQALLQRRITSEASIGKLLFQNGFSLMDNLGLVEPGDENLQERRLNMSQSLRELTHRIEILRTLALPR